MFLSSWSKFNWLYTVNKSLRTKQTSRQVFLSLPQSTTRRRQKKGMAADHFRSKVFLEENASSTDRSPAIFEKCILRTFGCNESKMTVGFQYRDGKLVIYPSHEGIRMEHAPGCPCCFLTATDIDNIAQENKQIGVQVGLAALIQSIDRKVLITRRSKHLRTFPGVWVPPGGHLEQGETLEEAAFRELAEETGITADTAEITDRLILGLWESVYPPFISMGLPKRHHVVVYLLARSSKTSSELDQEMNLLEEEVDAAAWLDEYTVRQVCQSDDYGQAIKTPGRYFEATVLENGKHESKQLCLSKLMASAPVGNVHDNQDFERISTGTKFALKQWLSSLFSDDATRTLQKADSIGSLFHVITHEGHQPAKAPFLE